MGVTGEASMGCELRYVPEKNRLYVVLEGLLSDEEAREAVAQIVRAIEGMKAGGEIINDMSRFRPLSQAVVAEIRHVAEAVTRKQLKRVVRVVGVSPTVARQVAREAREAGGYSAFEVATIEDAEALLERPPSP
jgi:hypothetical protein